MASSSISVNMSVDSSTEVAGGVAALVRGERLDDGLLVGAGIDRLHLDARVLLLEVGRKRVDQLGDRPADGNRIEERDLGRALRDGRLGDGGAPAAAAVPFRNCASLHGISSHAFGRSLRWLRCSSRCVGPMLHRTSARRQHPTRSTPVRRPRPAVGRPARTMNGSSPMRVSISVSAPRYSTAATCAGTPADAEPRRFRAHAERQRSGGRPCGALRAAALSQHRGQRRCRQHVHRRRADEARGEDGGGPLVEVGRRPVLLDTAVRASAPPGRPWSWPRAGRG